MTSAPAKSLFVIWAPDYTDADAIHRRLAVRATHFEKVIDMLKSGILKTGGVTVTPETYLTESRKMAGSMLVVEMESLEAVRKYVEEDVYWSGNVWDKEKVVIMPFSPAQVPTA